MTKQKTKSENTKLKKTTSWLRADFARFFLGGATPGCGLIAWLADCGITGSADLAATGSEEADGRAVVLPPRPNGT